MFRASATYITWQEAFTASVANVAIRLQVSSGHRVSLSPRHTCDPTTDIVRSGCGISGLALAAFISKFSEQTSGGRIAVDIYEAKPEVSTIGAGVAIWKRSWQVLQGLGFEEEIVKKGFKVPKDGEGEDRLRSPTIYSICPTARGPIFRKSDQPTEGYDFHNHMMPCSCGAS